ncbi:ATP-dependent RNA helicase DeaD [Rhodococcus ruber]|uniref:protein DpdJ n=1 Tax=Rhodococcus ruber TaxID=1830 RepID=UPI00315DF28D
MSESIQAALTSIELSEAALLAWGAVGAEWKYDELCEILKKHGDPSNLLDEMLDKALVVQTPSGGYRSRSAETVRLIANLRQAFRQEAVLQGRPLVMDYRFLHRPRRRPKRDTPIDSLVASVSELVGQAGLGAVRELAPAKVSAFQSRSTVSVLEALDVSEAAGVVVTAGTGSGKTLAFYLPMIAWICDQRHHGPNGVLALALYPRNELLKDQLRTLVSFALRLSESTAGTVPLSLATWFGVTPNSAYAVRKGWQSEWRERREGFICPFLRCPSAGCDSELIWPIQQLKADVELLRCTNPECCVEIPGQILRLTRDSARSDPAQVMLSTTESLNRQLSSPGNLRAFGIRERTLRAVLLDEVHTYEGTTGAQNAYLFRRFRKVLGYEPLWAGLSATLADAGQFFGRLVSIDPGRVRVVEPDPDELEESGAEYLLALRHNPHSSAGTLSTTIQTAMALSRCLDPMIENPFNPPINSGGFFGSRLFAFTDKLDSTNRLYWDLLDAEGWDWPGKIREKQSPHTLAHLRSGEQAKVAPTRREARDLRDPEGQYWWLPEQLGHEVDGDVQKQVGRTSSQDSGVAADAEIVVATASLEVGFDDDRVGAVLQHKAPHDAAQFLQRKGRAGRNADTRPWTVVVLSDWGRDREAWDAYDSLFSPVVPPRVLPLENLYVLRIQSVYSLLDWLAGQLNYDTDSPWADASGPADLIGTNPKKADKYRKRQERMSLLLAKLLRDGAERESLRRHLKRSLFLGESPSAELILEKIFWEAPRPLLAGVVPTLRRRLTDQWAGERPAADDTTVRTRTPLRDFVPGNLFEELLVPDVEFQVPWLHNDPHVEHLPALRALREFLPGNVSRHFGVWATNKRHWIPLPETRDSRGARVVDVASYSGVAIDELRLQNRRVRVFSPVSVQLQSVPGRISDASSMRPDWQFLATTLGRGTRLPLVGAVSGLFEQLTSHMHSQGGGVRILRYAESGRGTLWVDGRATPELVVFGESTNDGWVPAALGVEVHCDAIQGKVVLPEFEYDPSPSERVDWMREIVVRNGELPEALSSFDRQSLADALEAASVIWDWTRGAPDLGGFVDLLRRVAVTLGILEPGNHTALSAWIADDAVTIQLHRAMLVARESVRSADWVEWLERRFTLSAASLLLAALTGASVGVDADDLAVDLDPNDNAGFFISEQSPGGAGQIDALTRGLIEQTDRLAMSLMDLMRPTDVELMDDQLRSVIDSRAPEVRASIERLAGAWPEGHSAVSDATAALESTLFSAGLKLDHAARTALATRLAGPGASPDLLSEIKTWLRIRDFAEEASGLEVGPRTLAVLVAGRGEVDPILRLDNPSETRRSRAVANVLWPWGRSARPNGPFSLYSHHSDISVDLIRQYWDAPVKVLEFDVWDSRVRTELECALLESREVILRVPVTRRTQLRTAVIAIHTTPMEVGPLWCYPHVMGVLDRGAHAEVRVVLREAW